MDEREIAQKTANFADAAKQLGSHAGQALGTAAATGAVALAGVAVSKLYDAATKARDYRSMLAINPEVREFAATNPARANALFTSLRRINPEFSKDPFVAGEYMRRFSEFPGREGGYMIEAAEHRGRFTEPVLDTYLKGGLEGVKPRGAQTLPWGAAPGSGPGRRPNAP
jgi:hypothetical protein